MISILDMILYNHEKLSILEKNVKTLIKRRLKEKRWNYFDLAQGMQVQVLTVRRWMTSRQMKLDQFLKLMLILDVQLFSRMEEDFKTPVKSTLFTHEQETFLSENPISGLVFIKLVVGFKLDELKTKYQLKQSNLLKILRQLEAVNLLQLWPGEKIKIKVRGPFRQSPDGPFFKTYFKTWVHFIQDHFEEKFARPQEPHEEIDISFFRAFELYLSPESAREFSRDAANLFAKYRQLNAVEYSRKSKVIPISGIFAIDQLDSWEKTFLMKAKEKEKSS